METIDNNLFTVTVTVARETAYVHANSWTIFCSHNEQWLIPFAEIMNPTKNVDLNVLDALKVPCILQAALTAVLEAQPANPIEYLAVQYEWEPEKTSYVKQAAQLLLQVHHSREAFASRVRKAYVIVTQCPAHKGLRGLTGDIHMELLQLLTNNVPEREVARLMERLFCRATEIVPFSVFRTGIYTCLIFNEFVKAARELYRDLDLFNEGQARRSVCDVILTHLWTACTTSDDKTTDQQKRRIKAELGGIKGLKDLILTTTADQMDRKMSEERFLSQIVDIFMLKLH